MIDLIKLSVASLYRIMGPLSSKIEASGKNQLYVIRISLTDSLIKQHAYPLDMLPYFRVIKFIENR